MGMNKRVPFRRLTYSFMIMWIPLESSQTIEVKKQCGQSMWTNPVAKMTLAIKASVANVFCFMWKRVRHWLGIDYRLLCHWLEILEGFVYAYIYIIITNYISYDQTNITNNVSYFLQKSYFSYAQFHLCAYDAHFCVSKNQC